jgi:hypothetical protein
MATHVEIFLRPLTTRTTQSVVDDVSAAVGMPLLREPAYEDEAYAGLCEDVMVELFVGHGYEDDDDMPLSSHPFMLRFRSLSRDAAAAQVVLRRVYAELEKAGDYSMFATYDLQYRLDLK